MTLRPPAFNDSRTYGFEHLRVIVEAIVKTEGVVDAAGDHLRVTPAATGLRVDVAAGQAFVKGDTGTPSLGVSQGLYHVINDAPILNAVTLAAANATNPRLDQIVLRVTDSQDLGDANDVATIEVIAGTPSAGATLANRNGAAALTGNRLLLADVLVPANATNLVAGNVGDRRTAPLDPLPSGTIRPTAGVKGRTWRNETTHTLWLDTGTDWLPLNGRPGDIKATARGTVEPGWGFADGSAVSRTTYAELFAEIGTTYGAGDGATTFNLPDLRGRAPIGVDGAAARLSSLDALGQAGGAESVALTPAQTALRNHAHDGTTGNQNASHNHNAGALTFSVWYPYGGTVVSGYGGQVEVNYGNAGLGVRQWANNDGAVAGTTGNENQNHGHAFTTNGITEANGAAHTNLQPYQVVNYLVKL